MEIKYEIMNFVSETETFILYKKVFLKGELKGTHRVYESVDESECLKMKKELERNLK
jgi:hypothetical protein